MPRLASGDELSGLEPIYPDDASTLDLQTVCRVAAVTFDVPVAMIAIRNDPDRSPQLQSWVIAPKDACESSIQSLASSLATCGALVVDDLLKEREEPDPSMAGAGRPRFYAGVPVSLRPGVDVGVLCIMDYEPRTTFDVGQFGRLTALGRLVSAHLRDREADLQAAMDLQGCAEPVPSVVDAARREAAADMAEATAGFGRWHIDKAKASVLWSPGIARIFGRSMPPAGRMPVAEHINCYVPERRRDVVRRISDAFAGQHLDASDGYLLRTMALRCQSAWNVDPQSASNIDPSRARLMG